MKILFIINPGSGTSENNHESMIRHSFEGSDHEADYFMLPEKCDQGQIRQRIDLTDPDRVMAVGGDGTVRLVAECVMNTRRSMGIIPGGSANGLAKELGIPMDLASAIELSKQDAVFPIHVTEVNDHLCIHLSDIGFNAFVVKKFEDNKTRGMWGYFRAAVKTLLDAPRMEVDLHTDTQRVQRSAAMVVIANGTRYGSGAVINPRGRIDDDFFEIVIVRKISITEIFKMVVTHRPYDENKTEVFQSKEVTIRSRKKAHFQVDGEYLGKIRNVHARLIPGALNMVRP